jgi:hypothetical protein
MWSKPLFHACNLLGSLRKEIIETLLLTEVIAPPTMTDETELTIAGVTSLHEIPRGLAGRLVTMSRSQWSRGEAERVNKMSNGVIAAQRSAYQPTLTVDNGRPVG